MANWYKRVILPGLLNSEMGSPELEKIRSETLADVSGIVLEIGSGPGYNLPLYKHVSKLYALEPSLELIEIAQPRASGLSFPVEFLNLGAEKIPLPDRSVDMVVSTWTMCSVSDPEEVVREIFRVLRPQGRFVFVDHGASPRLGIRLLQKILTAVTKYFTGNCHYDRNIESFITDSGLLLQGMVHPAESYKPLIYNYQGVAVRP